MAGADFTKSGVSLKIPGDQITTNPHSATSDPDTRRALLSLTTTVSTIQDEIKVGFSAVKNNKSNDVAAILNRVNEDRKTWRVVFKKKDGEIKKLKVQLQLQEREDCNLQKEIYELRANLKAKDEEINVMNEARRQCDCFPLFCDETIRELRARIKAPKDATETNNLARWQNILNGTLQNQHLVAMQNAENGLLRACPTDLQGLKMLIDSDINQLLTDLGLSLHGSVEQRHYRLADYMGVADRLYWLTKGVE